MKNSTKQDPKHPQQQLHQTRLSRQPVITTTGTVPEPLGQNTKLANVPSFEIVLEAMRERHETKTAILQEALQRSEQAQQRFWGINE
jgi:hypothetical protein